MSADVNIKVKIEAAKAQAELSKLQAQIARTSAQTEKYNTQTQIVKKRLESASTAAQIKTQRLKQLEIQTKNAALRQEKLKKSLEDTGKGFSIASISLASFIGNITSRAVSAGVTTIVNGFRNMIQAGRDFEDGLVAVGKTTGISGQNLTRLGDRITKISREIPVATKGLLDIATVAGQLGLKSSDDIAQFTETLGKLTLASDIAGEEGAQSVAKILTITGELERNGSDNIDKFGNVITRLGNNFAATESQILKVANRVSQGLAGFGVSSEDVLALGAALKATGSEAEASGTAIQKTFRLIGKAVQSGGEDLKLFADSAGLSSEAFAELFKRDPIKAFERLATSLGQSGKTGAELNAILERLGLSDERLVRTLNPLIARYGELQRAISDARMESQDRSALDEEAAKAADTLSGDIQALSNSFDDLAKTIFQQAGPALRDLVQRTTSFLDKINNALSSDTFKRFSDGIAGIAKEAQRTQPYIRILSVVYGELFKNEIEAKKRTEELVKEMDGYIDTAETVAMENQDVTKSFLDLDGIQKQVTQNYVEAQTEAQRASVGQVDAIEKIRLFEQKKLQDLKKFFSQEEQAKLESNFAILKSDREREQFSKTFISEGQRRQQQAFLKTIGLDRATIEAERAKQEELKRLRSAEDAYMQELQQKEFARVEARKAAENDAAISREALRLFEQEREEIFTNDRLLKLQDYFSREEEARIQAAINAAKNEEEKQKLIAQAESQGYQNRLKIRAKQKADEEKLEKIKNQAILDSTAGFFGAIAAVARQGTGRSFEIFKAAAIAQAVVSTIAAINKTMAEPALPWPANIIQASAIGIQGYANVQRISSQKPAFENGGIVGGSSFTGDRIDARVNSGEMILNRQQQSQLFKMANGQGMSGGAQEIVVNTKVQLNEETIAEAVSRQVANGMRLGEIQ